MCVCISSLVQVYEILTVGGRQGCLMKTLTGRQDGLFSVTLSLFAEEVKRSNARRKLVNVPFMFSFTAEQSCKRVPNMNHIFNASISCFSSRHVNSASHSLGFKQQHHMEEIWFRSPGNCVENFICQDNFTSETVRNFFLKARRT